MTHARSSRQKRSERRRQEIRDRRSSQQERIAQRRRKQRLKRFGLLAGAVLLGVGVLFVIFTMVTDWRESQPPEDVQTTENVTSGHSEEPIDYGAGLPPVGGVHSGQVQPCDFYSEPVQTERAVHVLEHGGIWVTYQPDLTSDEINQLRPLADQSKVLVSPYPGLPSPVVATAWGNQLELSSVDDPDLSQFIRAFRNGSQAPEPNASC